MINLVSCKSCASVFDMDVLEVHFTNNIWREDGHGGCEVDPEKARHNGDNYVEVIECPRCDAKIDQQGNTYYD